MQCILMFEVSTSSKTAENFDITDSAQSRIIQLRHLHPVSHPTTFAIVWCEAFISNYSILKEAPATEDVMETELVTPLPSWLLWLKV